MKMRMVWALVAVLSATMVTACGGGGSTTVTETTPATDATTAATADTTTEATDTTATDPETGVVDPTEGTDVAATTELSQSDLAQQIAGCIAENGGDPKIDTLGDRVTLAVPIGPDLEQTVFAVLTDGRNAQNFVDKLIADGADPEAVYYSEEQPVVTYFPEGPPSKAVVDTVDYCVYEYEL